MKKSFSLTGKRMDRGVKPSGMRRRGGDILRVNDNSGGQHPYAACGARHCVYIASRAVEAGTALVDTPRQSAELMRFLSEAERRDAPFRHTGEGMRDPFRITTRLVNVRRT